MPHSGWEGVSMGSSTSCHWQMQGVLGSCDPFPTRNQPWYTKSACMTPDREVLSSNGQGGEQPAQQALDQPGELTHEPTLVIFISTCAANADRRRSIRRSWFKFKHAADSPLPQQQQQSVDIVFVASQQEDSAELTEEAAREGDILLLHTPEGYHQLWRKALVFLQHLVTCSASPGPPSLPWRSQSRHPDFVMHADDDSYVRLDLLMPLMAEWPRLRHYWGYVWDGTGARCTAPIRNPRNKSHMPEEQYALDYYPPFASGCGFVLSWDLVLLLAEAAPSLPDYRLLDPPFGIHLCGPPGMCLLAEPVIPVHEERVRPYRPLPTFRSDTLVQHYLKPEEMVPFHAQALKAHADQQQQQQQPHTSEAADSLAGGSVAAEQLYKQLVSMGLLRR